MTIRSRYTMINYVQSLVAGLAALFCLQALADDATATYLANEGVMVTHGETSIIFDPLFNNSYGRYELLPDDMRAALFAGKSPFDKIDAVFISHFHGDHFAPEEMLQLLSKRRELRLYAPEQAVAAMRKAANDTPDNIIEAQVTGINISYGAEPVRYELGAIQIAAARIPHSGWPDSMQDVENLAFRITLEESSTVLHLGDADTKDYHYSPHADFWAESEIHIALPPYWYFSSKNGQGVLLERLKPAQAVGIHVPISMPDEPGKRPVEYQGFDLFTAPGETRQIPHTPD
jgi:L-ascorbate metabolism protein UlaG (beta-lactamase superfamily)